jgi:hypothetical protein
MLTPSQIDAHDKRQAAVHEAGHLAVAYAIGSRVRAYIFRHEDKANVIEQKIWGGKCQVVPEVVVSPETIASLQALAGKPPSSAASSSIPLPASAVTMTIPTLPPPAAVAGAVATLMDRDEIGTLEEMLEAFDNGGDDELSPTDKAGVGDADRTAAVTEAFHLLQQHRRFFDWAVAELLADEQITDGEAAKMFAAMGGQST